MNTYQVRDSKDFAQAVLRSVKGSYRKANLVMDLIRDKSVVKALHMLEHTYKRHAGHTLKLLKSAINNAESKGLPTGSLYIRHAYATKAQCLKRIEFKGRGRTGMINKPYSHLTITIGPKSESKKANTKTAPKIVKNNVKTIKGDLKVEKGEGNGSKK